MNYISCSIEIKYQDKKANAPGACCQTSICHSGTGELAQLGRYHENDETSLEWYQVHY